MITRCPGRLMAIALFGILGCSSGDGGKSPTDPDDPNNPPIGQLPTTTNTVTIQPSGGSVILRDGTSVVFPAGAVSSPLAVTLEKVVPSTWLDGTGNQQKAVIKTTAPVTQFAQNVEIRVPLPEGMTPADSSNALAGVIDEETGEVVVEPSVIRLVEGKPFLVVETNHFTSRLFEWLFGETPPSSALLDLPYYSQGSSNYCWAASLHMVTQGASFGERRSIADIIGAVGVDESGITDWQFRASSQISQMVRARTGVRPDRKVWDYINANQVKDYLRREIGVNGRPVALHNGIWEHAVVVVGYQVSPTDGATTFRLHDPAREGSSSLGYTSRPWPEFVEGMTIRNKIVTLAVPMDLPAGNDRVAVNFLSGAFQFFKPSYGPEDPPNTWAYEWDYTVPEGFAYRVPQLHDLANPLPGEVSLLRVGGEIQLTNASRTTANDVGVYLEILATGAPAGEGRLSTYKLVTVGANSAKNLQIPDIPVDTFRYNTAQDTEYTMTADVTIGGITVDKQSVGFKIGSVTPEVTMVVPPMASVGDQVTIKGSKLGRMAFHNAVDFNGVAADSVVSWDDHEIKVLVPEDATTGPLLVKRGEVKSNKVDFTVSTSTTLSGEVNVSFSKGVFADGVSFDVTGTWSLTGEGAALDYFVPETNHYAFLVKQGLPARLSLDFSGMANPATFQVTTSPDSSTYVFHPLEWSFTRDGCGTGFPVEESGSGGNMAFTVTLGSWDDLFCANPTFKIYADRFDKAGIQTGTRLLINERTAALFFVKPR